MLDAIENSDTSVHFSETDGTEDNRLVNRSLNRVARILHNVKSETAQREKYYELILDCVNTGIIVLNDNGAIYQKEQRSPAPARTGSFHPYPPTVTCGQSSYGYAHHLPFRRQSSGSIRQRTRNSKPLRPRQRHHRPPREHLRILALNDINSELDEKEIDSWIRLTRVLTHEIMNTITPITPPLRAPSAGPHRRKIPKRGTPTGRETTSSTSKGLLAFVDSYRKFTYPYSRTDLILPQRLHRPHGGAGTPSVSRYPRNFPCLHRSQRPDTSCRREPHFTSHHQPAEECHAGFLRSPPLQQRKSTSIYAPIAMKLKLY